MWIGVKSITFASTFCFNLMGKNTEEMNLTHPNFSIQFTLWVHVGARHYHREEFQQIHFHRNLGLDKIRSRGAEERCRSEKNDIVGVNMNPPRINTKKQGIPKVQSINSLVRIFNWDEMGKNKKESYQLVPIKIALFFI